tara:strand:- start:733 stop:1041 length:309 start_codon:yes stop_codon:yes gene_type:complete
MKYKIGTSKIHNRGIIASNNIKKGEKIGTAINNIVLNGLVNLNITKNFGRLINHSWKPNSSLEYKNNTYIVIASKNIKKGDEITLDYRNTPWFILGPNPNWK